MRYPPLSSLQQVVRSVISIVFYLSSSSTSASLFSTETIRVSSCFGWCSRLHFGSFVCITVHIMQFIYHLCLFNIKLANDLPYLACFSVLHMTVTLTHLAHEYISHLLCHIVTSLVSYFNVQISSTIIDVLATLFVLNLPSVPHTLTSASHSSIFLLLFQSFLIALFM